jgi:HK97 family phage portal protein
VTNTFGLLRNKAPVPYVATRNALLSLFRSDDKLDQMRAMGSVGTLFAIANLTSEAISQVDWKLYRKQTDNRRRYAYEGMDARVEVTDHMALRVWNKPNPFMTQQEFIESYEQHRLLTGEAWWLPGRMNGLSFPTELWIARPDRMDVVPSPTDFLSGYTYRNPDGTLVPLELNEVIQLRTPNPVDPYRGWGAVQSILADLDASRLSAEWNRRFFYNDARPNGIIELPDQIDDGEFQRLKRRWREQHQGVSNAGRVSILTNGMKWVDTKLTQRDMQFVELRDVSREVIREAFHFPKPMLGGVDDINRANAEAGEYVFARWLVKNACERTKQALNYDFLPMFGSTGEGVEFDYVSPVPEDKAACNAEITAKSAAYVALVNAGADPELTSEYLGIPDLGYTSPPAPVIQPPAPAPDQTEEPAPAARLNGFRKELAR